MMEARTINSTQDVNTKGASKSDLARVLGPRIAIAVVVGNVIGSGIYLKPGTIASSGLSFPVIISTWVVGGLLCILGALCFAELAVMLPRAGGLYVYLREAYGRPIAFLFGWTEFFVRLPGSIAALAVAFVTSLFPAIGLTDAPAWLEVVMCAIVIGALAWVNILGVLWGGRLQMVFTIIKVLTLGMVILAPFALLPFVEQGFDLANYGTTYSPAENGNAGDAEYTSTSGSTFSQLGVILLAIMWAYNGWHGITPLAEEVRNPSRNIPIALFGGIGILIALYLSANFAYHGVLSMSEMAEADTQASTRMLEKLMGTIGGQFVAAVIMCSTFGAINTNLLQAPRIPFAMGRDRLFFRSLGTVHANYRTPAAAIFASAVMAIVLITVGACAQWAVSGVDVAGYTSEFARKILSSLKDGKLFNLLTDFVIFAASIFYTLTVIAVILLRLKKPDLERPYRTWGYPVTPLLFIGVYLWFLSQVYMDKPLEANTGLVLIAAGLPVYLYFRRRK